MPILKINSGEVAFCNTVGLLLTPDTLPEGSIPADALLLKPEDVGDTIRLKFPLLKRKLKLDDVVGITVNAVSTVAVLVEPL